MRLGLSGWLRIAVVLYHAWRPPRLADLTLRRLLARRAVTVAIVAPLGLALVRLVERFPDHPAVRLVRRMLDLEGPPGRAERGGVSPGPSPGRATPER